MSFLTPIYKAEDTHPILWFNFGDIPALQTRIATTHAAEWATLKSWCDSHRGDSLASFEGKRFVYVLAFALAYRLDPTRTGDRDKAVAVTHYIADQIVLRGITNMGSGSVQRDLVAMIAFGYDWVYSNFSSSQHARIQEAFEQVVLGWVAIRPETVEPYPDRIWGTQHGFAAYQALAALASSNDSSIHYDEAVIRGRLELILDQYDDGSSGADGRSWFSLWRWFDENGLGLTYKGAGSDAYVASSMEFYAILAPALKTAVSIDWWDTEDWLKNLGKILLWNWRGDRSFHRDGDNRAFQKYEQYEQLYFHQHAQFVGGTTGAIAQWMADEMQDLADTDDTQYSGFWGPYNVFRIIFDAKISPVTPTLANMNAGKRMLLAKESGRLIVRDDWSIEKPSWTAHAPKYHLNNHQHKLNGHWTLAVEQEPIFFQSGHYDPNDAPEASESPPQHHRWSYYQRIPSKNARRIFDTNEPDENTTEYRAQLGSGSIFIRNDGGIRWPKDLSSFTGQSRAQPRTLKHLLSAAGQVWHSPGWVFQHETAEYGYAVCDLAPDYYAQKCTKLRRHFLWIWEGVLPAIPYTVLIIYEDIVGHVDHVLGNQTTAYQLNSKSVPTAGPTGAKDLLFSEGTARVYHRVLTPDVNYQVVGGYLSGQEFWVENLDIQPAASARKPWDDSVKVANKNQRVEIFPVTYAGALEQLSLIYPAASSDGVPGAETLINEAQWIGVTFPGTPTVDARIRRGDSFQVQIGAAADTDPPDAPGQPVATPGDKQILIDWPDNMEADLASYRVERRFCEP